MSPIGEFAAGARSLARSPLGIIALFIVLVYAVASVVITLAKPQFYSNAWHPVVLFLAVFPVVVLFVFAALVARHHEKLYAPGDFKNQEHFLRTLRTPRGLTLPERGGATSDASKAAVDPGTQSSVDASYQKIVDDELCLIHQSEVLRARTEPRSGRYRVRVWVECFGVARRLNEIECVTYRIWNDFNVNTFTTRDVSSKFDLWLSVYGEFPVLALIRMKDGSSIELQRFLDLPGRPPD